MLEQPPLFEKKSFNISTFFNVVCISWTIKVFDIIDARFNLEDLNFLLIFFFRKNIKYQIFFLNPLSWICSVRTERWMDRQTDRHDDASSLFRYIVNAPKNET